MVTPKSLFEKTRSRTPRRGPMMLRKRVSQRRGGVFAMFIPKRSRADIQPVARTTARPRKLRRGGHRSRAHSANVSRRSSSEGDGDSPPPPPSGPPARVVRGWS